MRRDLIGRAGRRTILAFGLSVLALVSACSSDAPTPSDEGTATVAHAFGETVVPVDPQRVVSVGYTEQDTLLALGVVPVGVTEWYGDQPDATWPWAHDLLGGATPEVLTVDDGFQFEKITALDPDLIVGTNAGMTQADYDRLSTIAPTIAHSNADTPYFEPWDTQTRTIGDALGKSDEANALIESIRTRYREAAEANPDFAGRKAVFLQNAFYDDNAIAYQNGLSTDFLTSLGFEVPSELDAFVQQEDSQAYIPLENLAVLDVADVLLWATESPDDRAALEANPVYSSLQEVRDGRLVFTDAVTAGAIYFTSPLSLPYLLDTLVPAFASTLSGGGPATTVAPA